MVCVQTFVLEKIIIINSSATKRHNSFKAITSPPTTVTHISPCNVEIRFSTVFFFLKIVCTSRRGKHVPKKKKYAYDTIIIYYYRRQCLKPLLEQSYYNLFLKCI